jgi:hypothetical protein
MDAKRAHIAEKNMSENNCEFSCLNVLICIIYWR